MGIESKYRAGEVVCDYCGQPPESHEDSDAGPMTVCEGDPLEDANGYSRSDLLFGGNW